VIGEMLICDLCDETMASAVKVTVIATGFET